MMPGAPAGYSTTVYRKYDFADWCYDRRDLWPGLFLAVVASFFTPTVVLGLRIAQDATASYWLRSVWKEVLLIPILIVICHILHVFAKRPRFWPTFCSTVVPSIIVIYVGLFTFWPAHDTAKMLQAADCTSYKAKFELDQAYRSAAVIFDSCVQRVAASTNSTADFTAPLLDIQDCSEYSMATMDAEMPSKQWAYLSNIEQHLACSGWCTPGEPALWSRNHYKRDLCAHSAGDVLENKIWRLGQYMMWIGIIQLIVSAWGVSTLSNSMFKHGVEW